MARVTGNLVITGISQVDVVLNDYVSKRTRRRLVNGPARQAMNEVYVPAVKANSRRTNEQSKQRWPKGSAIGPSVKYFAVRAISARSKNIGVKAQYNIKKFPDFVVKNKQGEESFYPASQEYGADTANPPIKPKLLPFFIDYSMAL